MIVGAPAARSTDPTRRVSGAASTGRPSPAWVRELVARRLREARLLGRRLYAGERALPSFLVVGAQRGGTTSLFRWLCDHPQVQAPLEKEIQFFTLEWQRGLDWYGRHFDTILPGRVTFEASPYYLYHPLAPARVAATLPAARLVALLREPVARAWSHHHHVTALGYETLPFAEALAMEPQRLAGEEARLVANPSLTSHAHRHYSYLDRGRYHVQLERWQAACPDRLLALHSADLFRDPHATFQRVLEFLELDPWRPPTYDNRSRHRGGDTASPMPGELARSLRAGFLEANARLQPLVEFDLGSWAR